MTTTNGVGGTTDATGTITSSASGGTSSVDFNTYLKLLVAQLKNQDPLNPLDGTQFTAQLAQFSTLEQQINTNTKLSELISQRDYGQQTLANSYLGKVVLAPGDTVASTGTTTEFGYKLDTAASSVSISIADSTGKVVRSVVGDVQAGNHIVTWDGKDDSGTAVASGNYTISVKAVDSDGKTLGSTVLTYGKVASAMNDNGTSSLVLSDGRQIDLSDVLAVTSLTTS